MLRKNQKQVFTKVLIMATIVALAVMVFWVGHVGAGLHLPGNVPPAVTPPHSKSYGESLTDWLTVYWRWMYGEGESKVGRVQLLPLPEGEQSGSGTEEDPMVWTGQLEITLEPGTPFVLPLFAWIGERYEGYPDVPDDVPFTDEELIAWVHPNLTIDGRTMVSDDNKAAFYVGPTSFDPPIWYAEPTDYESIAAVWFQGFGIVSQPLSVGEHVIHLYEPFSLWDAFFGVYDNTWIVTVAP